MSDAPDPYNLWRVRVTFMADRGGDAFGAREVTLTWNDVRPDHPAHRLLMALWIEYHADAMARAATDNGDIPLGV